jgi:hypothetical protein
MFHPKTALLAVLVIAYLLLLEVITHGLARHHRIHLAPVHSHPR